MYDGGRACLTVSMNFDVETQWIITFGILDQTKFLGQSPRRLWIVCAKLHVKRLRIDWHINEKRSSDVVTSQLLKYSIKLRQIHWAVAVIPADGACKITKNGWELTSELTSKWIIYWNTQANFTLISLKTLKYSLKLYRIFRAVAIIPFDGACKITWKTVENWRLNWRLSE